MWRSGIIISVYVLISGYILVIVVRLVSVIRMFLECSVVNFLFYCFVLNCEDIKLWVLIFFVRFLYGLKLFEK